MLRTCTKDLRCSRADWAYLVLSNVWNLNYRGWAELPRTVLEASQCRHQCLATEIRYAAHSQKER